MNVRILREKQKFLMAAHASHGMPADTTKARRFGFHEAADNEEMLHRLMTQFQRTRFIHE